MPIIITHQSVVNNWISCSDLGTPQTLVLGSFNPFNRIIANNTDYYYGRKTNYFWRAIASIVQEDDQYFFDVNESLDRKVGVMRDRFCCMDIINQINISADDEAIAQEFVQTKVLTNFLDQTIWTTNTVFKGHKIHIERTYNQQVIESLRNGRFSKVIHTMGTNRIENRICKPKEKGLRENGFSGFMRTVFNLCDEFGINFINESYSPSQYAVNSGKTNPDELKLWLAANLNIH